MKIRTRIAPSPTGEPHVGTAYIALFNMLFARSQGGHFILRIEDTDQARSQKSYEESMLHALQWLGIDWDEGPDKGGKYGPYRQSERKKTYKQYANILLKKKHAFRCFCSSERLDKLRASQIADKKTPKYDGHCQHLTASEVNSKLESNDRFVIRMKVPSDGVCTIEDLLRGTIEINWQQIDMQILVKSDGMPTYHLANVVDDHLMEITHVIRGEEWINSAPKHQLLYRYFDWKMPVLCHMPLLRNPDKSKLSKRKNPTSINYYKDMGYLPEAMLNYLARMGWSMPDETEKFSLEDMLKAFDIKRVSLGGPIFDQQKLSWLNGAWIRENITEEKLCELIFKQVYSKHTIQKLIPFAKNRIEKLSDFSSMASFIFNGLLDVKYENFLGKKLDAESVKKTLQFMLWDFENITNWQKDIIFDSIKKLSNALNLKLKDVIEPVFIAIVGKSDSWSVIDSMAIIGPNLSKARLKYAIDVLGGWSKKSLKTITKEYSKLYL